MSLSNGSRTGGERWMLAVEGVQSGPDTEEELQRTHRHSEQSRKNIGVVRISKCRSSNFSSHHFGRSLTRVLAVFARIGKFLPLNRVTVLQIHC